MHKDNNRHAPIEIHPQGKIIYNEWVYDHEKGEGEYVEKDVSLFMDWMHKRDERVWIHPDVIFNDIFKIVSTQSELCDIAFPNCFIAEYVSYWNKLGNVDLSPRQYDPKEIEFLELYWAPEISEDEIDGVDCPWCHGQGFELKEDYNDGHGFVYEKGNRINWGIDFCKLEELLPLPIKINPEFQIYENWENYRDEIREGKMKWKDIPKKIDTNRYLSLGQVIEALFWEISFYGCEDNKMEQKEELDSRKDELDEMLETNTVDELVEQGKLVSLCDDKKAEYPITCLTVQEELNDGYINDGIGWEKGYN